MKEQKTHDSASEGIQRVDRWIVGLFEIDDQTDVVKYVFRLSNNLKYPGEKTDVEIRISKGISGRKRGSAENQHLQSILQVTKDSIATTEYFIE